MTQAAILAQSGSPGTTTGFKNRIINGDMRVSQRNGTTAVSQVNGAYNLDRWYGFSYNSGATTGKYTVAQSSSAPAGFINSLLVTSSTALATSANDIYGLGQVIEGLNTADLGWGTANGKSCTLSFFFFFSLTGTFGGAIRNQNGNYGFPYTYTISAANTWQQVVINIPAPPVGSTWQTDNSQGIYCYTNLQIGANFTNSATGAWQLIPNSGYGATGCVNILATNGATFYMTGVQFEVGTTATNFDFRSIGTELALCQRYYEKSYNQGQAVGQSGSFPGLYAYSGWNVTGTTSYLGHNSVKYKVTKRTTPSVSVWDNAGNSGKCTRFTLGVGNNDNQAVATADGADTGFNAYSSGTSNNSGMLIHWAADAEL